MRGARTKVVYKILPMIFGVSFENKIKKHIRESPQKIKRKSKL